MPQDRSLGIFTGLLFVAAFLAMIGTFNYAARYMQSPLAPAGFELSGSSHPVRLNGH